MRWETPPPSLKGRFVRFLDELAERPGEWAVYRDDATSHNVGGTYRRRAATKGVDLEVAARSNGDGTYRIYMRIAP